MPVVTLVDTTKPGTMVIFGGDLVDIPKGYLLCNGDPVSRTTYPRLFDAIKEAWGNGDGVNTFHLPDMQGRFPRGVDSGIGRDPDAGARLPSNTGGNSGDNVGTTQTNQFGSHNHGAGVHNHDVKSILGPALASGPVSYAIDAGANTFTGESSASIINTEGGNENRPENSNVYYIIKF